MHSGRPSAIHAVNETKLHVLIPANNPDVNLCKTLLTANALGYPDPTLLAWGEAYDTDYLLGGGSHLAKISAVLKWLEETADAADDDLVVMMDAYDIWFQLRPEVLIERYYATNEDANERMLQRLGSAVEKEGLKQTIIFGSGKRCAPNQVQTIGCFPIPESPLPKDLYGNNTDSNLGRNLWYSFRQRWLNSGFIMGPKADLRALFKRAAEKATETERDMAYDDGSHGSDFMYHGSDQALFAVIFGEQEYQREVMRRRHYGMADKIRDRAGTPAPNYIYSTLVDDPLNPSFHHQPGKPKPGKPDEFGIGLDYFSDFIQQTVNSEEDSKYIVYENDIPEQVEQNRETFDCPSRVTGQLPNDILRYGPPLKDIRTDERGSGADRWDHVPLYTNLCLNRIPIMIHHNGDKAAREYQWESMWVQRHARNVVGAMVHEGVDATGGAHLPDRGYLPWTELCPPEYDQEIFR